MTTESVALLFTDMVDSTVLTQRLAPERRPSGQERRSPDTSGRRPLSTARRRAERPSCAEEAVSRPSRRRSTETCAIRRVTTGWKPRRA